MIPGVQALTFDVFGTVVDWRTGVIREGEALLDRPARDVPGRAVGDDDRRPVERVGEDVRDPAQDTAADHDGPGVAAGPEVLRADE